MLSIVLLAVLVLWYVPCRFIFAEVRECFRKGFFVRFLFDWWLVHLFMEILRVEIILILFVVDFVFGGF